MKSSPFYQPALPSAAKTRDHGDEKHDDVVWHLLEELYVPKDNGGHYVIYVLGMLIFFFFIILGISLCLLGIKSTCIEPEVTSKCNLRSSFLQDVHG